MHQNGRDERMRKLLVKINIIKHSHQQNQQEQFMDIMLYKAAQKDDVDSFIAAMEKVMEANSLSLHNISKQKTRIGNTFLHVAVSRGNENLTSFIVFYFRDLIWVSNKRGNTAFHEASRAGHLGCLEILVRFENYDEQLNKEYDTLRSWNKSRWRSKNKVGNTSLHEAFFNNQRKVVDYLIKSRVEEAYYVNNEGKSVLYLAVEADMVDIVNSTLSNMVSDVNEKFMSLFTMGRSLINVALRRRNTVMLKELLKKLPALVHVVDEDGQNALFYAVSTGYQDGLIWLIDELKMDCSQMSSMGFFPCSRGIKVQPCPHPSEVDTNLS
ncbi:protein ACCELERATED CELL DEATH 6-like [Rutidosis leptorrhynchoides]|uniref:protein ACCELERATED CELL DEATH 6-like n=1 Tax=Rutidosis leptorrhynchoides TaxID=125765 RepID=UPI003A99A4E3